MHCLLIHRPIEFLSLPVCIIAMHIVVLQLINSKVEWIMEPYFFNSHLNKLNWWQEGNVNSLRKVVWLGGSIIRLVFSQNLFSIEYLMQYHIMLQIMLLYLLWRLLWGLHWLAAIRIVLHKQPEGCAMPQEQNVPVRYGGSCFLN